MILIIINLQYNIIMYDIFYRTNLFFFVIVLNTIQHVSNDYLFLDRETVIFILCE